MTAIAQAESRGATRTQGGVRLRVPVKLTAMLPEARSVSVYCIVTSDSGSGSGRSAIRDIVNGEFDQVMEVVAAPRAGDTLIAAKSYICRLELYALGQWVSNPRQGTPPSPDLYKLARPDSYFRAVATGALDGGTVNDEFTGPDRLAVPPKRRQ